MRLGLVARADDTGIGVQCLEFFRNLKDHISIKVLVIDLCHLSPKKLVLHQERFMQGGTIITPDVEPDPLCLEQFLRGLDVVYTVETPYNYELFAMAAEHGIKTVLHVNSEFNDYVHQPELPKPSLFAAPTRWLYDSIPDPKILLPVPVALDRFTAPGSHALSEPQPVPAPRLTSFLHTLGHPAIHDRAGTKDLLAALPYVTQNCNLTIKCQDAGYLTTLGLSGSQIIGNVNVMVDTSSPENYWDLYRDPDGNFYDVMVLPRRYGGLSLPMNEALAAGIPVIMPSISPNDDQLPSEWLTPARRYGQFMAKQSIDLYRTRRQDLAAALDDFADPRYRAAQQKKARALAEMRSWDALRPKYLEVFTSLTKERKIQ